MKHKSFNRTLAVLLSVLLIVGLLPTMVFAAENEVDVWDGTAGIMKPIQNFISKQQSSWRDLQNSQILESIPVRLQVIPLRIRLYI